MIIWMMIKITDNYNNLTKLRNKLLKEFHNTIRQTTIEDSISFNDIGVNKELLDILFDLDEITKDYRNIKRSSIYDDGTIINKIKSDIIL